MDRRALINALQRSDSASRACSAALTRGADFEIFEELTATAELRVIYRRRAAHVEAVDLEQSGFEEALADLEACGAAEVRLGYVTDDAAQHHYQLFISADTDEVVACLWVHNHD